MNPGAKIVSVQWDFDYRHGFSSTPVYSLLRSTKEEPTVQARYEFPRTVSFRIAWRAHDDMAGEGLCTGEVEVE